MPSLAESRRQVREKLQDEEDHDAILAGLQDEIDGHNAIKDDLRDSLQKTRHSSRSDHSQPRSSKFRFKATTEDPRKERSKHHTRSRHDRDDGKERRKKRRKHDYPTPPKEEEEDSEAAHPFPREPLGPLEEPSTDAFRASLFDALADDEGAAAYWESVYNQPIHIYPRPSTVNEKGELEQMDEDEYVDYVKQKMWEKKHPEILQERKRKEGEQKLEEEERTRKREEFVRRKEQAAWERSQRRRYRDDDEGEKDGRYEYEFAGDKDWSSTPSITAQQRQEYASAWAAYLSAWDRLKHDLLGQHGKPDQDATIDPSKRMPWPVLASKPPIKANIQDFMRHAPSNDRKSRLQILKAERVRWHPDKVQQRFGGTVDERTMKLVTGVFQVLDVLFEEERQRG